MNTTDIVKGKLDKRSYKAIELSNKLTVFMISDPETEKSAASINVGVGAALDPKTHMGAAHFLEHMLFQGSEKYPKETEYDDFMSNHGGMSNAFTSLTETNYHFNCSNEAFEEGLDRTSQFFISPMFSAAAADKEVNAVDSEFNMSLQNDSWHFFNLIMNLAEDDSKLHRFMCGNKASLQVEGMRDHLLDFHKKWYSSNIMHLVMISNSPIADLERWATEKFSEIKNLDVSVPYLGDPAPFPAGKLGKLIKFVPIQDEDTLRFFWTLPLCQEDWKSKPLNIISELIGHEGENSLLSYLKQRGLALKLYSGPDHEMDTFSTMDVTIKLSEKGVKEYETVVEAVFQYLQRIRDLGPQEWLFEEIRDIGVMNYEFKSKQDQLSECVGIARNHRFYKTNEDVNQMLRSKMVTDKYDAELIKKYLDLLCESDQLGIFFSSKKAWVDEKDSYKKATFYDTPYDVQPFTEELQNKINNPKCEITSKKLDLPPKNTMIPKNFDVLAENKEKSVKPTLIQQDDNTDLWYHKDDQFLRPKAVVQLKMYINELDPVMGLMWQAIVDQHLKEYTYQAETASLKFDLVVGLVDVNFTWNGFNDSMPNFIKETLMKIGSMKNDDIEDIFNQVKETQLVDLNNFYMKQSFQQIGGSMKDFINERSIERSELREKIETLTYAQFKDQLGSWMKAGRSVWLVSGNISEDQAKSFINLQKEGLPVEPLSVNDVLNARIVNLSGNSRVNKDVVDPKNDNSAFISYYQFNIGNDDLKDELTFKVVSQFLDQPYYNELRTEQQLGYVVSHSEYSTRTVQGARFLIQSAQHGNEYCIHATNKWLVDMKKSANEISDKDFELVKGSVHTTISEKDINLVKVHNRSWGQIASHEYKFDKQSESVETLKTVTKADFTKCFNDCFFSENTKRIDFQLNSSAKEEIVKENEEYAKLNKEHEVYQPAKGREEWADMKTFFAESKYHDDKILANYKKFRGQ